MTLRNETEWKETVEAGWNVVVGADYEKIVKVACSFKCPDHRHDPYGDGRAAERMVKILMESDKLIVMNDRLPDFGSNYSTRTDC